MTFKEREYQRELDHLVCEDWRHGARDVMPVLPCGGGKTVIFCNMLAREPGACVIIVHRNHLVGQASKTLARNGVRHRVIGSKTTQATCVSLHMNDPEIGRNFVDPTAQVAVAGVGTLVGMDGRDPWFARVSLVITDEAHHLLRENSWGKARAMFVNARGAAFTATAMRPDGKGLGRHADGVIDSMVEVIGMRDLIKMGYLADYRIYAPPNSLDLSSVGLSAGGDYSPPGVRQAVHKAKITGDVVEHYLRIAPGKLGATFAVDVEAAKELTAAFRSAGVPAELITGDTPEEMRDSIFRRYRARQVLQLISVDVLGEGTDVPAMEVISLARPTASWVTYVQQFCRPLRPLDDKVGIIIDHVGNVERHAKTRGLPDTPQRYSLDRRERTAKNKPSDAEPTRTCSQCSGTYSLIEFGLKCPYCLVEDEPAGRSTPAQVDGMLHELDPEVLRALRREVERVDGPGPHLSDPAAQRGAHRNHIERQRAQQELRASLALWGGWQESRGRSPEQAQRAFFVRYGITAVEAAALGAAEARALDERVREQLQAHGVHVRESQSEGERIRAWFEAVPEGQSAEECAAAVGVLLPSNGAGHAIGRALGEGWVSRQVTRNGSTKCRWFRADSGPDEEAIRSWFGRELEGKTSKECARALGLSLNGAGNLIARALGDRWEIRTSKRDGKSRGRWFRVGSDPEGDAIRAWFESMPEGQSSTECAVALSLGCRSLSAVAIVALALGNTWESRPISRDGHRTRRWFRVGSDPEGDAIRAWFESMPEGQTAEDAAKALSLISGRPGKLVAKAIGEGWKSRQVTRKGVNVRGWFRTNATIDATVNKEIEP